MLPHALRCLAAVTALWLGGLAILAQTQPPSPPQELLIDTDIGDDIDDAFAVALALRTPQLQILGITTTFGDTQLRAHLVLRLLADAGRGGIPVAAGVPTPPATPFTQAAYARGDRHELSSTTAVDLILQQARQFPGQVTLLALGPLFNVGAALQRDPEGFRKLRRVVMMGGSLSRGYDLPNGSPSPTPSAEWNIENDVDGARELLASNVPIFLMPLDSTQIPFLPGLQDQLLNQPNSLDHGLQELLHESGRKLPILYDAVTAAYAEDPTVCTNTRPMHLEIVGKGFTRETPGPPNANVCLHSDQAAFLRLFRERLDSTPN